MAVRIVHSLSQDQWRDFVDGQPLGNIFHTPEMFQVFAQAQGHRPTLWAAVDDDEHPIALLLIVRVTLIGGPLCWLTSRAIAYGSVLCSPGLEGEQALALLLQAYNRSTRGQILFTELRNLSDLAQFQPILAGRGFAYEEHLNYLIDLDRLPEAVLQSIGRRTRKRIRRVLREGTVRVQEIGQLEQVALCYDLLEKSYAAARVPLADRSLFESAFEVLWPKGMIKFLLAWVSDDCVAGSVELVYKDRIYGWYSGVDRAYSSYAPNELLMWHILQWGAENGYRLYDFGGAGKPSEEYGVRDFKAKFGGELVCYGRYTCVHSPNRFKLSKLGYRLYQKIF